LARFPVSDLDEQLVTFNAELLGGALSAHDAVPQRRFCSSLGVGHTQCVGGEVTVAGGRKVRYFTGFQHKDAQTGRPLLNLTQECCDLVVTPGELLPVKLTGLRKALCRSTDMGGILVRAALVDLCFTDVVAGLPQRPGALVRVGDGLIAVSGLVEVVGN
jgi:hypothetical protein